MKKKKQEQAQAQAPTLLDQHVLELITSGLANTNATLMHTCHQDARVIDNCLRRLKTKGDIFFDKDGELGKPKVWVTKQNKLKALRKAGEDFIGDDTTPPPVQRVAPSESVVMPVVGSGNQPLGSGKEKATQRRRHQTRKK
jgi:hypothetical protein